MDLNLDGKSILVAGSSRGVGRGIAEALLEEGAYVLITGRTAKDLEETRQALAKRHGDRVAAFEGDLGADGVAAQAVAMAVNKWARLNAVVANVGTGAVKPGWDLSLTEWAHAFQTNFWTSVRIVEASIPALLKTKGAIALVSSIAGVEEVGAPLGYTAAKSALTHYAKSLARQLASDGIRVNTVAPGNILFPGGRWESRQRSDPHAVEKMLREHVPLGRFGTPREVGDLVAFLVSDRSAFTTGTCVIADGGQTAHV